MARSRKGYGRFIYKAIYARMNDARFPDRSLVSYWDLEIDEHGNIISYNLVQSSGNRPYDRACQYAIRVTKRITPPPKAGEAGIYHLAFSPTGAKR